MNLFNDPILTENAKYEQPPILVPIGAEALAACQPTGGNREDAMDIEEIKRLVKIGNLKVIIESAVLAASGTLEGLAKDIDLLLRALTGLQLNRLDFGLAAAKIRLRCKSEQNWMPVGRFVAQHIHRSYSTLDHIINAAEKAATLGEFRLAALIEEVNDPTERKYDKVVDDLLGRDFSGSFADARNVVQQALDKFRAARKEAADKSKRNKAAAEKSNRFRMRQLIRARLRNAPPGRKDEIGSAIYREFAEAFEAEFPGSTLELSRRRAEV